MVAGATVCSRSSAAGAIITVRMVITRRNPGSVHAIPDAGIIERASSAPSQLSLGSRIVLAGRIDAQLAPDMGELRRVGQPAIRHHGAQRGEARF